MAGITTIIKITALSSILAAFMAVADDAHVDFATPMGEEEWHMTGSRLRCGLSLGIPNYGVGYFEQFATKDPHFILRTWDQVQRTLPLLILASPPVWKPIGRNFMIERTYIKPGEYGVFLPRDPALKLLAFISKGYEGTFNYRSEQGITTTLVLSPIKFKKAYAQYRRCLGNLLPFDYPDIKELTFHFGTDNFELSESDKVQLRRVAEYVAADEQVDVVRVVGYADDSGRKGYNNAISQFRAEAIEKYLASQGVPKKKMYVTWVGAQQPVARNDTDDGRAANRRVVLNVLKK